MPGGDRGGGRPRDTGAAPRDSKEQRGHLDSAVDALNQLPATEREQPAYQFLLACCYRELARTYDVPSGDAVDPRGGQAIDILTNLVERFPDNHHYRHELIETLSSDLFGPPQRRDRHNTMREFLYVAHQHADDLVEQHPYVPEFGMSRMHVLHKLGHILMQMAREERGFERDILLIEAHQNLNAARSQIQLMTRRWPQTQSYRLWSVVVDGSLAQVLMELDQYRAAVKALRNVPRIVRAFVQQSIRQRPTAGTSARHLPGTGRIGAAGQRRRTAGEDRSDGKRSWWCDAGRPIGPICPHNALPACWLSRQEKSLDGVIQQAADHRQLARLSRSRLRCASLSKRSSKYSGDPKTNLKASAAYEGVLTRGS